jgi:isopentenyl diphosphate isomerase/L-lactate dehydrogenase-like FMN-dependent dehydrogenase
MSGVINILRRELEMAMHLTGKSMIQSIDRPAIWPGPA